MTERAERRRANGAHVRRKVILALRLGAERRKANAAETKSADPQITSAGRPSLNLYKRVIYTRI